MFPISSRSEVAIFKNRKNKSFEMIRREKDSSFNAIKESMKESGNGLIASYPVWFNICTTKPMLNPYLTQRIFSLILSENGYDYVFFRRLYEITEELKRDEELLDIINKAISHRKTLTNS
ncbi:MAG: hypothetical protein ACRDDY_18505, partial [Clostridium sp.]|uniref:hypothetical protein n=1 Tax=Clostridium sp. TaxID=1506 RepID=UPI003EE67606